MSREEGKNVLILSPLTGRAVPLEEVPDPVFSQKIIGDGMAVIPTEGKIVSPADAQIVSVADTGHAYGLKTEEGVELLIHVGLETVSLKGECFKIHVKPGDTVKAGDLLAEVDLEFLEERKINPITPVLICGGMEGRVLVKSQPGQVEAGKSVLLTETTKENLKDEQKTDEFLATLTGEDVKKLLTYINSKVRNIPNEENDVYNGYMVVGALISPKNDIQNRCFEKIAESLKNIKGNRNRATLLHYLVNELHLFTDGNGRTGRCIFELLTNPEFSFEKNNNFRHTRKEASRADGDIGTNEFESNMHVKNYQKALAYASFLVYKSLMKNNLFSKGVLGKCIYVASDVELLENEYDGSKVFIPEDIRIKLSEKQLEDIDVALCDNNDTELYSTAGLTMAVMQSLKESTIKEKKFEPVPDYTVCDICVGQDECYLEESKKTFDSWTKEDYLRAVKVADYIKEAKLDAMIDIFEHPENFIVEGIGTIADILSGDIYEGVEYPLEIMAKLQQNCKTNFDGTRMQKSIELLEKTLQQNIEEVSKGNIQSVESLVRQVVPEMEDVKDVDKTENRIERDILGKSQTEEKLK